MLPIETILAAAEIESRVDRRRSVHHLSRPVMTEQPSRSPRHLISRSISGPARPR